LEHAEEISFLIFPTGNQSAEVVVPGEKAFDFPATAVAAQLATVLRAFLTPIDLWGAMSRMRWSCRRRWSSGSLSQARSPIISFRCGAREALLDSGFDKSRFMQRSAGDAAGDRKVSSR